MSIEKKLNKVAKLVRKGKDSKALKKAIKLDAKYITGLDSVTDAVISDIYEIKCAKLFYIAHDYATGRTVIQDECKAILILIVLVSVGYTPALEVIEGILV